MCGIYGSTIKYSNSIIQEKLERISFRGPDFSDFKLVGDVILGHNRLAIIDLDPRSNQPFAYMHLHIVFNGEVYNYLELKDELIAKGFEFNTSSDTEVICAAYLAFGKDCVKRFNGMFAFTIYDSRTNVLFGARDRLGKKPFYYYQDNKSFEFASQPSQISLFNNFSIDEAAISEYLIWGYIPEPKSIWSEVKKLPAGHLFTFNVETGDFKTESYWDLDFNWQNRFEGTYEDAKNELRRILTDSVRQRMIADVPLGVFLSGGIDSSIIASIASGLVSNLSTFSVKFNEEGFDESTYASQVAQYLKTDHHTIECNFNEGIDLIKEFSTFYDEPFADSSAIPSMLLAKYTKQHVTVALSGDGGDEAFIGYPRYSSINKLQNLFKVPEFVRGIAGSVLKMSPVYKHKLMGMGGSFKNVESLYVKFFGGMENSWVKKPNEGLMNPYMYNLLNSDKPLVERVSDFDIKTYLNGDINTKVDRASMAFSLETRAPLMDYRIIEFSRSLPTAYKFSKNGVQKRILKDVLYEYVPEHLFDRPKAGFAVPLQQWFRTDLKEYVLDTLSEKELRNLPGINVKRVTEIIQEHMSGKWNRHPQIFKLLILQQWMKRNKSIHATAQLQ